jgi:hypothetical protein
MTTKPKPPAIAMCACKSSQVSEIGHDPATDTAPRARVRKILDECVGSDLDSWTRFEFLPILFSAPMILALLAGAKTQTRRVVTCANSVLGSGAWPADGLARAFPQTDGSKLMIPGDDESFHRVYPRRDAGDTLWVRETCRAEELPSGLGGVRYPADGGFVGIENSEEASERWGVLACYGMKKSGTPECRTVPSIHMPRWASRITLEIADIRVERLNDISEADALAEGIHAGIGEFSGCYWCGEVMSGTTARECYARLWDSINGPGSWEANPYVWCLTFKQVSP